MAREQIIEKLDKLLTKQPFTEECQVMYLMVEIWKAIEKNPTTHTNLKLLKYYRDWIVHPKKEYNNSTVKFAIEQFYVGTRKSIIQGNAFLNDNSIIDFIQLTELKRELIQFFTIEELNPDLFKRNDFWSEFVKLIYGILSDQPIVKPTSNVSSVEFSYDNGIIEGKVYFSAPIHDLNGDKHSNYNFSLVV